MVKFDMTPSTHSIITIIGVGGGGNNAISYMLRNGVNNVHFVACNTDKQVLNRMEVPTKIQLGPQLTKGLGAGAKPEIGRQATEESLDEVRAAISEDTKLVFIAAGMGGGTGTGGAPVIAKLCREMGILTVGVVTLPFAHEGASRKRVAEEGIKTLEKQVDTLVVVNNNKLTEHYGKMSVGRAFTKVDEILSVATKAITSVINETGEINLDFADISTVIEKGGVALISQACAQGDSRVEHIVDNVLNSPLLNDHDIHGAKKILVNIAMSQNEDYQPSMEEISDMVGKIQSAAGEQADVLLGVAIDPSLEDALTLTLVATGFKKDLLCSVSGEAPPPIKKALHIPSDETPAEKHSFYIETPSEEEETKTHTPPMQESAPPAPSVSSIQSENTPNDFSDEDDASMGFNVYKQEAQAGEASYDSTTPEDKKREELYAYLQRGREEAERRRAQLHNYSTRLPLDFDDPNSEVNQNPHISKGSGEGLHNPNIDGRMYGGTSLKPDSQDANNITLTKGNKFLDGHIPD